MERNPKKYMNDISDRLSDHVTSVIFIHFWISFHYYLRNTTYVAYDSFRQTLLIVEEDKELR